MKLLTLTLCLLLLLHFSSTNAQEYFQIPDSSASWLVQEHSSEYTLYHNWFLSEHANDTIISGKKYTKVFEKPYGTGEVFYSGAFRNDPNGKTYYLPPDGYPQEESTLQDFTKKDGDTVHNVGVHYGGYLGSYDFVVDSVRYYACGPFNLKFIALHTIEFIPYIGDFMPLQWIEKIGCTSGGIYNQPSYGFNLFKLICCSVSDTILYAAPVIGYLPIPECMVYQQGTCEYYLDIKESVGSEAFSIYPNPFNGTLTISTAIYLNDIELRICDIMGKIVITENVSALSEKYVINLPSFLPNGTYILNIIHKNKQLWKRLITKI